jgi:hypothetical protein
MRTAAERQLQAQRPVSSRPARSRLATPDSHHRRGRDLHSLRASGNQAVQRELQTRAEKADGVRDAPPVVHEVLRTPGQPLDAETRALMQRRFRHEFSEVRVHTDARAAESAAAVQARAYTVGQHIVIGAGQPSPETMVGRRLIAHELAHVVQQSRDGNARDWSPSAPHEREARAAETAVASGEGAVRIASNTGPGLARQPISGDERSTIKEILKILGERMERLKETARVIIAEEGIALTDRLPGGIPSNRVGQITGALERIAGDEGSPRAGAAAESLRRIADNQSQSRVLNQELKTGMQQPESSFTAPSAEGPLESAPREAEAVASDLERTALKTETEFAGKAGSFLKLGTLLEAALPGPQDVLFLWIGFFGSLADAKEKISDESYLLGFSEGVAANLLGFAAAWVREELITRDFQGSIGERVAGFSGVRQRASNRGAVDGFRFIRQLDGKQRIAFLQQGFAILAQQRKTVGPVFNFDDVLALGLALQPTIEQLFEVAREQEAARLAALQLARDRVRGHGWAQP